MAAVGATATAEAGRPMTLADKTRRHVGLLRTGLPESLVTSLWTLQSKASRYVRNPTAAAALSLRGRRLRVRVIPAR